MNRLIFNIIFLFSGCTYLSLEGLIVDCDENPVGISVTITNSDCGADNGSASLSAIGGEPPYNFQVGEVLQEENLFVGLAAGNYEAKIIDVNQCFVEVDFLVGNQGGLTATSGSTLAGCQTDNATLTVFATNGEMPYIYSLNGQTPQSSNIFDNLAAGNQTVMVTDNTGCEFILEKKILAGLSYVEDVMPILMNNCAVTGCHNGTQFPDLRLLGSVQNNKANIKSFTQTGFMPLEGSITQTQIDAIACWIDDGALDN